LLLTVLGELVLPSSRPVWTSALLHVLSGLDVEEKSARQAIARTAKDGWIVSTRDGRRVQWELTASGRKLLSEGAARIYSTGGAQASWDRSWLVVLASVPESQRKLRHRLQTRLAWAGLGNPSPGLWVSTHHERAGEVRKIIDDLDLGASAMSFVGPFGEIGSQHALVERAWDFSAIALSYINFLDAVEGVDPGPGDPVLLAQVQLVHAWRRFPFIDPQLPAELLPNDWIGHTARARFELLHTCWQAGAQRRWAELTSA
jgi:phenylacetic acid degradation operon negative regulatory protein